MKKILLVSILLSISICSFSQLQSLNSSETSTQNGRFEIIQSPVIRKCTFRIDKESGTTWILVKDKKDNLAWDLMVKDPVANDIVKPNSINYQIFLSGYNASDCFLININSGTTWQLVEDSNDALLWQLMD